MSKTIIINEKMLNSSLLKEGVLLNTLPDDIKDDLKKNETSLGANPAFPDEYGDSFDTKLTLKRFKETKKTLEKIGEIEDCDDIANALPSLIEKCKRLEEPIKNNLEKIAYNFIVTLFNIPEGSVNFSTELKEDLSSISLGVRVQSEDSEFQFDSVPHKKNLNDEIKKRRVINALMTGGAMRIASNIKKYVADIYELEPKLPDLYRKILALNDYMLFTNKNEIVDSTNQLGMSKITIGNEQTKSEVVVEGAIFPILIYEEVRAFLELSAAHGLPMNKEEANYVMTKADYLQAEPWDMRLGPAMWDSIMSAIGDIDDKLIPYVFMEICKLNTRRFNIFMQEILVGTKKGEEVVQNIVQHCIKKMEYSDFENRLKTMNAHISTINDEFIHPDEL